MEKRINKLETKVNGIEHELTDIKNNLSALKNAVSDLVLLFSKVLKSVSDFVDFDYFAFNN